MLSTAVILLNLFMTEMMPVSDTGVWHLDGVGAVVSVDTKMAVASAGMVRARFVSRRLTRPPVLGLELDLAISRMSSLSSSRSMSTMPVGSCECSC